MDWIKRFSDIRMGTIGLCKSLGPEDMVVQSIFYASPPKWHMAHTTWFFEEMILKKLDIKYSEFNPKFKFLFNSYYNTLGDKLQRDQRGVLTRPGVSNIYEYRDHVDTAIIEALKKDLIPESYMKILELGLNHEQQHQELLITDLKYTFGLNPIFPIFRDTVDLMSHYNKSNGVQFIDEGIYTIGHDGNSFCFDNEMSSHKVYLNAFKISKSLVTNGEYLEFINDKGYSQFNHWLDEGWHWINQNKITSPLHWHKMDGEWFYYTLSGLKKVKEDAILTHISFYEANAYANWRNARLPTEFEWEVASEKIEWGKRWEWTQSAYLPYPGFKISDGAVGEYNGKFMVNQMVLRGASAATPPNHSRKTYRNFFHPHLQWQFSGIRLIED